MLARKLEGWGQEIGITVPDALVPSGRSEAMAETGASLLFAFLLAMIAIYMVLASLFNSLIHPFTIMMAAPLSFIGAFLALKVTDTPLDMMSGIGMLVLMGLVMKNGILLIDYINQLRDQGLGRDEAVLEAGPARLRPVLMTAFSLILGLFPVAFSDNAGSEFRAGIATLTIGGMATSTFLTLLIVPVVYSLVDQFLEWFGSLMRRLFSRFVRAEPVSVSDPAASE